MLLAPSGIGPLRDLVLAKPYQPWTGFVPAEPQHVAASMRFLPDCVASAKRAGHSVGSIQAAAFGDLGASFVARGREARL